MSDQLWAAIPLLWELTGKSPCQRGTSRLPDEECFQTSASKRWSGVWETTFEGSHFYAGKKSPPALSDTSDEWLVFAQRARGMHLLPRDASLRSLVRIAFIGRRTSVAGHHGHLGMSKHLIIVDQVIGAQLVR